MPYAVYVVLFYLAFIAIGAENTGADIDAARAWRSIYDIPAADNHIADFLLYFSGVQSPGGHLWYVLVTLYAYIAFFVGKQIFDIRSKRLLAIGLFAFLLAIFAVVAWLADYHAHYWRNLWALVLGLMLALYEREILAWSRVRKLLALAAVNIIVLAYVTVTHCANWVYVFFADCAFVAIYAANLLFARYELCRNGIIVRLAAYSYAIYLVHGIFYTIEWYYIGYQSVMLILVASVLAGILVTRIVRLMRFAG